MPFSCQNVNASFIPFYQITPTFRGLSRRRRSALLLFAGGSRIMRESTSKEERMPLKKRSLAQQSADTLYEMITDDAL